MPYVVIIPSFLAIVYFGQSIYLHFISWFQSITSSYLASDRRPNNFYTMGGPVDCNKSRLVHGCERAWSCSGSSMCSCMLAWLRSSKLWAQSGGIKFRHALFVIIESGMALFAIQMARVVLSLYLSAPSAAVTNGLNFVILINERFNVIIRSVHF